MKRADQVHVRSVGAPPVKPVLEKKKSMLSGEDNSVHLHQTIQSNSNRAAHDSSQEQSMKAIDPCEESGEGCARLWKYTNGLIVGRQLKAGMMLSSVHEFFYSFLLRHSVYWRA